MCPTSQVTSSLSSLWDLLSELRDERARNRQQIQCLDCTWKNRYYLVLYWHLAIHLSYSILSYCILHYIALYIIYIYRYYALYHIFFKLLLMSLVRRLCFLDSENKEFVILHKLFQVCLFRPISFLSSAATHGNDAAGRDWWHPQLCTQSGAPLVALGSWARLGLPPSRYGLDILYGFIMERKQ